jgi:predicted LPLAT superfamily acyltransferase
LVLDKDKKEPAAQSGEEQEHDWVENVEGNRAGTLFFHRIIEQFGIRPAYVLLFFAAWYYVFFDRNSVAALRQFRERCGMKTRRRDLYRHFRSFGIALIDRFVLTRGGSGAKRFVFTYSNEATIAEEVKRGGGVILLGAHMGNWEIAGALLGKRLATPVHVFMYDQGNTGIDISGRSENGVIIHPVQTGGAAIAVEIINALRGGEIVCLHGDRYYEGQRTIAFDFLGALAHFPAGPMAMAAITGASVLPCFTMRTSLFHYEFSAAMPIRPESADRSTRDETIRTATERYVRILEETCGRYPDQWYNFYRFWSDSDCFSPENGL